MRKSGLLACNELYMWRLFLNHMYGRLCHTSEGSAYKSTYQSCNLAEFLHWNVPHVPHVPQSIPAIIFYSILHVWNTRTSCVFEYPQEYWDVDEPSLPFMFNMLEICTHHWWKIFYQPVWVMTFRAILTSQYKISMMLTKLMPVNRPNVPPERNYCTKKSIRPTVCLPYQNWRPDL